MSIFGPPHNLLSVKDAIVSPDKSIFVGDDGEVVIDKRTKSDSCNCCKTKVVVQNGSGDGETETKMQIKKLESLVEKLTVSVEQIYPRLNAIEQREKLDNKGESPSSLNPVDNHKGDAVPTEKNNEQPQPPMTPS